MKSSNKKSSAKSSAMKSSAMKSTLQRVMFTCLALLTAAPAAALSGGGIAGVTIASAVAVGGVTYLAVKHRKKRENEQENQNTNKRPKHEKAEPKMSSNEGKAFQSKHFHKEEVNPAQTKRAMKRDVEFYKSDLKKHQKSLDSLRRKGKADTKSAMDHKARISELRQMIDDLENKLDEAESKIESMM